jgi:hypothetical protein
MKQPAGLGCSGISCNLRHILRGMEKKYNSLFGKENFLWMAIGGIVIIAGILLMSGGKSPDPTVFKDNEVYSTRRITIAPILIIIGFLIEVYAIMKKPKAQ